MAKVAAEQAELANRVPGDFRWEAASMDEREQRALQLLAESTANGGRGWSMRAIERQTGVTRYKVAKLAVVAGLVRHRAAMAS
jgi:alkylhydroperoxidase family enzyme